LEVTNIQRIFAEENKNIKRMKQVEERYISLLTDFGFKRIFGTAMNKDLLICFLNSLFNGRQVVKDVSYLNKEKIRHHVQLCDTATHKVFYDKLEYIYVEISKFNKPLEELDTLYEKWLYALKNLYKLTQRPKELCDKVFDRLFEEAEIAKFTPQEMREYETSKMAYRDIKNSVDTAKREGIAEGMEKGMKEGLEKGRAEGMNQRSLDIARNMLADGVDINLIMKYSGLTQEQIEKLK